MKAEDLKLLELLDFKPEEGLIHFKDRKIIRFQVEKCLWTTDLIQFFNCPDPTFS